MSARPRSRPVADAPVPGLLAQVEELARRWAISLIVAQPFELIGELPLQELSREAPPLCGQIVRALASEEALERLLTDPRVRRIGALAGARDPAGALRAVEALRGVLWDAISEQLSDPPARRVADLADRLAYICSCAAIEGLAGPEPSAPIESPSEAPAETDDLAEDPSLIETEEEEEVEEEGSSTADVSWELAPRIEIRDIRGEEGPAAWVGSIGRRLTRYAQDGLPFAVLLVELVDLERLLASESPAESARLIELVEGALSDELRPADQLTRESQGRYWLVTPETDAVGARVLAGRLARTVRHSASHGGAPLEVAIGIAVCPEDGREAAALAARADVGAFAARAAGQSIAPADDPA